MESDWRTNVTAITDVASALSVEGDVSVAEPPIDPTHEHVQVRIRRGLSFSGDDDHTPVSD